MVLVVLCVDDETDVRVLVGDEKEVRLETVSVLEVLVWEEAVLVLVKVVPVLDELKLVGVVDVVDAAVAVLPLVSVVLELTEDVVLEGLL
mmetsp:Transcript_9786/g.22292  ORF Transcript_9786/g.22292 Transcript_9786/m.22292 type:complete len:90 (+) Transcript_9786:221-490(+)